MGAQKNLEIEEREKLFDDAWKNFEYRTKIVFKSAAFELFKSAVNELRSFNVSDAQILIRILELEGENEQHW